MINVNYNMLCYYCVLVSEHLCYYLPIQSVIVYLTFLFILVVARDMDTRGGGK